MISKERKAIIDNILNGGQARKSFPFTVTEEELEYITKINKKRNK